MAEEGKRYAVVTGANRGVGFGIVRQLASNGFMTVLTARDEKRGIEAVEKLKECGLSDLVVLHQLDVTDPASIDSLADFVTAQFGKLDILLTRIRKMRSVELPQVNKVELPQVNNAGVNGTIMDPEALRDLVREADRQENETNYYGTKKMTKDPAI